MNGGGYHSYRPGNEYTVVDHHILFSFDDIYTCQQ